MATRPKHLKKSNKFPRLAKKSNDVTSDADPQYNCIAYAIGRTDKRFWPKPHPLHYWPPNVNRGSGDDLAGLINLFELQGYARCNNGSYEAGVEKIAIYTLASGRPTHAARQIASGKWASKLGEWFDIEHSTNAVSGGDYGEMTVFMSRRVPSP